MEIQGVTVFQKIACFESNIKYCSFFPFTYCAHVAMLGLLAMSLAMIPEMSVTN